jgi:VWFA-related protein
MFRPTDQLSLTAVAVVLASGLILSAAPQQTKPDPQRPVFRAGAYFVTVDVTPTRDGAVVDDLTADDFELLENGKPQKVESFEFVPVEHATPIEELKDPNNQREMLERVKDPRTRVFVIFLDVFHVSLSEGFYSRSPIVHLLDRLLAPTDLFGVMTPHDEPWQLTFARKTQSIEEQLAQHWIWGVADSKVEMEPAEVALENCYATTPMKQWLAELYARYREDLVLTKLEDLSDHLGGIREGRKVVFIFTHGWRLFRQNQQILTALGSLGPATHPPVGITSEGKLRLGTKLEDGTAFACDAEVTRLAQLEDDRRFRDLMGRASRANVSFYPVNPAGLMISTAVRLDLESLASETGGAAVVMTNDMKTALDRLAQGMSGYYLLGYASSNTKFDGSIRTIKVNVKRPGVTVRARRGYVAPTEAEMATMRSGAAPAPASPATASDREPLENALAALSRARPSTTLHLYGRANGRELTVVAEIVPPAGTSRWRNGGDVQVMVTANGDSAGVGRAALDAVTRSALVRIPIDRTAGPWQVRVRVQGTGESPEEDTVTIDAPRGQVLGDPIIMRGTGSATAPPRPAAARQFLRSERLRVEWPVRQTLDRREARLLDRTGQPLPVGVALAEGGTGDSAILAADLTLAPLAIGDYVLEVTATVGVTTDRQMLAFRVSR